MIRTTAGNRGQTEQPFGYIMGYFTESPECLANAFSLHLASSRDGRNWTALNRGEPVLSPRIGEQGMRDPFLFRKQDGSFIVVATNMWNSESIMCYESPDLIHFEAGRLLRLNNIGMHAWAPEVIFDPERMEYAILWSGNTDRNRIYVSYTADFFNVTEPEVFFDPGYDVIDASISQHEESYCLTFKDERKLDEAPLEGKRIKGASAVSLRPGSFDNEVYSKTIGEPMIEGPVIIRALDEDKWYLFGDCYWPINAKGFVWETADLSSWTWRSMNRRNYHLPPNAKHISIVGVDRTEWNKLICAFEQPDWQRLRSYILPDYYVRTTEDLKIRLAPIPFDPFTSCFWKPLSGLACPDGITFESVHRPGYYLRSKHFVLELSEWEDNNSFREESTFVKSEGLSNSSWVSLSPYLYPEMYIIIDGELLRISSINQEEDKPFATFQLSF